MPSKADDGCLALLTLATCLLPGGHLLCSVTTLEGIPIPGAKGGRMLELDWDGKVVWECTDHDQHHDLLRLANGNTLITESLNGRVFEVAPTGEIVWDYIVPMQHPNPVLHAPSNALFRAYRYEPGGPELSGRRWGVDPRAQ